MRAPRKPSEGNITRRKTGVSIGLGTHATTSGLVATISVVDFETIASDDERASVADRQLALALLRRAGAGLPGRVVGRWGWSDTPGSWRRSASSGGLRCHVRR